MIHVLTDLSLDAELIMKGYLFHKGRLKVVISKVFTPSGSGEMQPMSQSHFVEISCVALAGQVNHHPFLKYQNIKYN